MSGEGEHAGPEQEVEHPLPRIYKRGQRLLEAGLGWAGLGWARLTCPRPRARLERAKSPLVSPSVTARLHLGSRSLTPGRSEFQARELRYQPAV